MTIKNNIYIYIYYFGKLKIQRKYNFEIHLIHFMWYIMRIVSCLFMLFLMLHKFS